MNALELANFIRDISEYTEFNGRHYCQQCFKEAQDMLLQQHAEIEALKQVIDANNLSQNIGQFVKPAKTLTDEEIIKVYEDMLGVASARSSAIDFAKAILRKAQEK
jgi:hypothetical protein